MDSTPEELSEEKTLINLNKRSSSQASDYRENEYEDQSQVQNVDINNIQINQKVLESQILQNREYIVNPPTPRNNNSESNENTQLQQTSQQYKEIEQKNLDDEVQQSKNDQSNYNHIQQKIEQKENQLQIPNDNKKSEQQQLIKLVQHSPDGGTDQQLQNDQSINKQPSQLINHQSQLLQLAHQIFKSSESHQKEKILLPLQFKKITDSFIEHNVINNPFKVVKITIAQKQDQFTQNSEQDDQLEELIIKQEEESKYSDEVQSIFPQINIYDRIRKLKENNGGTQVKNNLIVQNFVKEKVIQRSTPLNICPSCLGNKIQIKYVRTPQTWLLSIILLPTIIFWVVPLISNACKDVNHFCEDCIEVVAVSEFIIFPNDWITK